MLGRLSRILVADESETSRAATHACLLKLGYSHIDHVPDGRSALSLIGQRSYSLVLADWETPRLSGADLLRQARAEARQRCLPFLMVIPQWQRKFIEIVRKDGAVLYLTRPFTAEILGARMVEVDRDAGRLVAQYKPIAESARTVSDLWRNLRPEAYGN